MNFVLCTLYVLHVFCTLCFILYPLCRDADIGDTIGITGDPARELTWAFRILRHALSDNVAFALRDEFARFLAGRAGAADAPWTCEQAQQVRATKLLLLYTCCLDVLSKTFPGCQIIDYIDRCWLYPDTIRRAFIEAGKLGLPGYVDTTGQ